MPIVICRQAIYASARIGFTEKPVRFFLCYIKTSNSFYSGVATATWDKVPKWDKVPFFCCQEECHFTSQVSDQITVSDQSDTC